MAFDRVSTYGVMQANHRRLEDTQKSYRALTEQIERGGQRSDFYRDIADESQDAIAFQATIMRYENYQRNTGVVKNRLAQSENALDQIGVVARGIRDDIMMALNPGTTALKVLQNEAPIVMKNIQRLANVRSGGVFLFSGASVDQPPVDITLLPQTGGLSLATDTAYYLGSAQTLTMQLDDDVPMAYGVTAGIPGIERILRSLVLVRNGGSQPSVLQDALTAAEAALADLDQQKAALGLQIKTIEQLEEQQEAILRYSQDAIQALATDDLASIILKQRQTEQQLEAIYATLRNSMKTSLVNYLRS